MDTILHAQLIDRQTVQSGRLHPLQAAAEIAVATVQQALQENGPICEVIFCCYSAADRAVYEVLL